MFRSCFGKSIILYLYKKLFGTPDIDNMKVWDEGLNPFFSSLSAYDQKTWYANEVYRRKKMGIVTLADHSLEVMRSAKRKCKTKEVIGIHNYEILSNYDYAHSFGYTSIEMRQNEID